MQPILEVRGLIKQYPGVRAVDGVAIAIPEGACFGLLGPNGAGKTTTIEMVEGVTAPDGGEILFRGKPAGPALRHQAGIQFQSTSLPDYLTVREVLRMFGCLYPQRRPLAETIAELAELCALSEFIDRDTHKLSGGQRQRVLLAIALVNDPAILFLDEPTTGLDPQARRNFWDLVRKIKARGKTIVLTTHYMEEAYVLCDEIAIMDRGHIIAQGAPDHLLKQYFEGATIEIPRADFPTEPASIEPSAREQGDRVLIRTPAVNDTLKKLIGSGVTLNRLHVRSETLEDLFLELTGREMRA